MGSGALSPLPRGCPGTGPAAPCPAFCSADPVRVGTAVHGTAAGERQPPHKHSAVTQGTLLPDGVPSPWPAPTARGRLTSGPSAAQAGPRWRGCGVGGQVSLSQGERRSASTQRGASQPSSLTFFIDKRILGFFLTEMLNAQCGKTWKQPERARLPLLAWTVCGLLSRPHPPPWAGAPHPTLPTVAQGGACLCSPAQDMRGGVTCSWGSPRLLGTAHRSSSKLACSSSSCAGTDGCSPASRHAVPRPQMHRPARRPSPPRPPAPPRGSPCAAHRPRPSSGCISWSSPGAAAPWAAGRCFWGPGGGGGSGRETRGAKPHYEN